MSICNEVLRIASNERILHLKLHFPLRPPFSGKKLYLWDWSIVPEPGPRFENFVASQLLKYCHFREDTEGYRMNLRFLRDTDKREVDFVVLEDGKPCLRLNARQEKRTSTLPSIILWKGQKYRNFTRSTREKGILKKMG